MLNLFVVLAMLMSTLVFAAPAAAGNRSPDLVDWADNFDSYATGSQMHGQGGWKGWGNTVAAGALTSSAQAVSAPNSVDINGGSDLVHEYTGYTAGTWIYTAWQYVPVEMTGVSYFILLNQYDDAGTTNNWSTQVNFDASTNLVTNEGVSGGTLALIKGQWVEINVLIDLTADTQAFYYNHQLLFQGTWTNEQSGAGTLTIGAVDLFANGATAIYYDDISLVEFIPTSVSLTAIDARSAAPVSAALPIAAAVVVMSAGALFVWKRRA
jgi:hypothetical protein